MLVLSSYQMMPPSQSIVMLEAKEKIVKRRERKVEEKKLGHSCAA